MYFQSTKLYDKNKSQSTRQVTLKVVSVVSSNKYLKFLLIHFAEYGNDNFSANDSLYLSNLKNPKTNTVLTT